MTADDLGFNLDVSVLRNYSTQIPVPVQGNLVA